MGSEMCIRDSLGTVGRAAPTVNVRPSAEMPVIVPAATPDTVSVWPTRKPRSRHVTGPIRVMVVEPKVKVPTEWEEHQGLSLDELLAQVESFGQGKQVRIITIAYGPEADTETLAKIARVTKGASYKAPSAADIPKVYAAALSNL